VWREERLMGDRGMTLVMVTCLSMQIGTETYGDGDQVSVPEETAKRMIEQGVAERVSLKEKLVGRATKPQEPV
jgi:hypothetical protein